MRDFFEFLKEQDPSVLSEAKDEKWMARAVKKPGSLNAAAKKAKKSKSKYCAKPPSGKAAKRCALWKTFNKTRKKKKD